MSNTRVLKTPVARFAAAIMAIFLFSSGSLLCLAKDYARVVKSTSRPSRLLVFVSLGGADSAGRFMEVFIPRMKGGFVRRSVGDVPVSDRGVWWLTADPTGRCLFFGNAGYNTNYGDISYLKEYSVGPGGRLKLKRDCAPTLWSATSLAFDPVAQFAYMNTEKRIIAYRVSCRGGLITIQTIVVDSKDERLYDIFIPKSGRYLYIEGYHSLWASAIGRTGRLTPVGKPAVHAADIQNGAITSAPGGRCLCIKMDQVHIG